MSEIVPIYGLHQDEDNFWWLVQANGNNFSGVGLPPDQCPLMIRSTRLGCPHNFDLSDLADPDLVAAYDKLAKSSELLRLISPVPYREDKHFVFIETTKSSDFMVLNNLLSLAGLISNCSAHRATVRAGDQSYEQVMRRLNNSTIGRYMIYGIPMYDEKYIQDIIHGVMMTPGRLFIAGVRQPLYGMERMVITLPFDEKLIDFDDKMTPHKYRQLGASLLKRFMRS